MDSAAEELCLQKLEELVFDEDKIVTISVLCRKLDVSLLEAKELLGKYVSDQKINPGKIAAAYLISGKLKTGEHAIEIVDAACLKEKKKQFESITDKVVYSVQKNNEIDLNLIALSEQSDDDYLRPAPLKGSIVSEKCTERDIKTKVLPPLPPPKNFEKQKPSSFFKPVPNDQSNGVKQKPAIKELKPQTQKAGGLTSFLSQSSTSKDNPQVKKEKSNEDEPDSKKARIESNNSEEINDDEVQNKNEVKSVNVETKSAKNKKTPKKDSGKNDKDGKKRKRIIVESESDDDLFANVEDERMEVMDSDEEQPVEHKPKIPAAPVPKNKRRKAVEKTYEDEEGYVVTRTEYVLVSASEDEEENVEPPKKENKAPKPEPKEEKKISPPKGGKKKGKAVAANQPTLMNFFKKK